MIKYLRMGLLFSLIFTHMLFAYINGIKSRKELFDRLVAKGKNKKLDVIAVANKLLKQVFGVIKNECLFDRNYYKKIP